MNSGDIEKRDRSFEVTLDSIANHAGGHDDLERRVAQRTAKLEAENAALRAELAAHRRDGKAARGRVRIQQCMLDNMVDGVIAADEEGRFLFFNPAAERILGRGLTEARLGRWPSDYGLFLPDGVTPYPTHQLPLARAMRGEVVEVAEMVVRHSGAPEGVWISVDGSPLRDEAGDLRGGIIVFRDMTRKKQAEEEMRHVQSFLTSIVENIPNMIFVKDANELRFVRFNRAGEELLGASRDELIGKNDYDLFPREEADFFTAKDRAVLDSGDLADIPEEDIHTRQGVRTLHTKKIPIRDEAGKPQYLLGISEDITERKQTERAAWESLNLLRAVTEGTTDAIYAKDRQGRYLMINSVGARFLGKPVGEIIGKDDTVLFSPETARQIMEGDRRVMESGQAQTYEEVGAAAGVTRTYLSTKDPLRDHTGSIIGIVGIARDITERKQAETKLEKVAAELARSNEELQHFAYVASHDLQEPLRMVASYTQLLARRYKGRLDDDADEFIAFAVDGAKRMQTLINDLLKYSRAGSGIQPLELTDLNDIMHDVLANLTVAIEESGASVTHDELPTVPANATQLTELLQNLIGNALKFRRAAVPPQVHVSARRQDGEWHIGVRDNGIGIPQEQAGQVFLLFQRLHGRNEYPGTGIGLAVCKKIVERHGGRLWVESSPDAGSTFCFTLPDRKD